MECEQVSSEMMTKEKVLVVKASKGKGSWVVRSARISILSIVPLNNCLSNK